MTTDYDKNFEIRRAMICHEDTLISHRLAASMTIQSFMVAAATLIFVNARYNPRMAGALILAITIAALVLCSAFYLAIHAARVQQARIRGDSHSDDRRADFDKVFPLEPNGTIGDRSARRLALQSHGTTFIWGFSYVHVVQLMLFVTWMALLAMAGVLILDKDFTVFGMTILFTPP
jgi:hypothetical protein